MIAERHTSVYRPGGWPLQPLATGQRVLLFGAVGLEAVVFRAEGRGYYVMSPVSGRLVWWEAHHLMPA